MNNLRSLRRFLAKKCHFSKLRNVKINEIHFRYGGVSQGLLSFQGSLKIERIRLKPTYLVNFQTNSLFGDEVDIWRSRNFATFWILEAFVEPFANVLTKILLVISCCLKLPHFFNLELKLLIEKDSELWFSIQVFLRTKTIENENVDNFS